jgi:hypothetical protein
MSLLDAMITDMTFESGDKNICLLFCSSAE